MQGRFCINPILPRSPYQFELAGINANVWENPLERVAVAVGQTKTFQFNDFIAIIVNLQPILVIAILIGNSGGIGGHYLVDSYALGLCYDRAYGKSKGKKQNFYFHYYFC